MYRRSQISLRHLRATTKDPGRPMRFESLEVRHLLAANAFEDRAPPIAVDDTYPLLKNDTVNTSVSEGLLANDAKMGDPMLSAVLFTPPEHGVLMLGDDGSFTYHPYSDFTGIDQFTYKAVDDIDQSAMANVELIVAAQHGVIITEFMAQNRTVLRDKDGDYSDWIELHNPTDQPVNLGGAYLTDDASDLTKWQFTDHVLMPSEYLVVFASGKDHATAGTEFHTNFRLTGKGEDLVLVLADGTTILDSFSEYPEQTSDISYGRFSESQQGQLATATPGAENAGQLLPAVIFSHSSGTFTEDFQLTMGAGESDVKIRYTRNGTIPTNSSLLYEDPIGISKSTEIRARMFGVDGAAGQIVSRAFTQVTGDDQLNFSSNLPVLLFDSFGTGMPASTAMIDGHLLVLEPGESGRTTLTSQASLVSRVMLKRRGSGTVANPKPNLRIELRDELDNDRNVQLLGMPAEADWVLYGPYNFDRALVRDPFMHKLEQQMGRYSPRCRFVEVFGNFNGGGLSQSHEYQGVYVLTEQIQIGPNRVDIAQLAPSDNQEPEVTGGYIIKVDRPGAAGDVFGTRRNGAFIQVEPDVQDLTSQQRSYIRSYVAQTENAIYSANPTDPETGYPALIDIPGWIDEHILRVVAKDPDGLRFSTYLSKDRNGKLTYGPLWDFDRALAPGDDQRSANPQGWSTVHTDFFRFHWWKPLFLVDDFAQNWVDRWWELRKNVLTNENFLNIIDLQAAEVAEAQVRNFDRWPHTRPNGGQFAGGVTGWEGEIEHLKGWLQERLSWIDAQTLTPVEITAANDNESGTNTFTLSTNEGVIYYNLDGSDPRAPGGGVSDTAVQYTEEAIVVNGSTNLITRAFDSNSQADTAESKLRRWSAPKQMMIFTDAVPADALNLRISEINYNPLAGMARFNELEIDGDEFEFIELVNTGDQDVNLAGVQMVQADVDGQLEGISFTFESQVLAPNERTVVVKNIDAFGSRYADDGLIATGATFTGNLANSGERITLLDYAGQLILEFDYDDGGQWPGRADGRGSSLEVIDLAGDYNDADNWQSSIDFGGSPGEMGSVNQHEILINEVLANSELPQQDTVELANTTNQVVDLSGWFLSDSNNNYFKFQVPAGTTIPAGGYLVLDEQDFNAGGGSRSDDFLLSSQGDDLTLLAVRSGQSMRFVDRVEFDATEPDVSLGRIPDAVATASLLPQVRSTLAAENLGQRPARIIISEVHYNPSGEDDAFVEFIELYNNTTAAIDMAGWRIDGAVDFEFAPNAVALQAGQTLILVGFDPLESSAANIFRATYEIGLDVTLAGPWQAQDRLDNGGEKINLQQRADISAADDEFVPILVDQVDYDDDGLWPGSADGLGDSLHRRAPVFLGNQPASWAASLPTPGSVNFTDAVFADFDGDGRVDDADIDLLGAATRLADDITYFDLDVNGPVTRSDLEFLVEQILGTRPGDTELDGDVDVADLTQIIKGFTGAGMTGGRWATGDNDGDGDVDTRDFTTAIIHFTG